MMYLDQYKKLVAVLTSAKTTLNLPVAVDAVDITSTATTPLPYQTYTNGLTPVDILPAPAAATVRKTNGLSIYGRDTTAKGVRIYLVDATPATGSFIAGAFVIGNTYQITAIGDTNFTLIGASANTVGVIFDATGAGTGTGTASTAYQQVDVTLAVNDVLGYTDTQGWYTQDLNGARKLITTTQFGAANTWTAQQTFSQSSIVPTLSVYDSSTKEANAAFVQAVQNLSMATMPLSGIAGGTYSFAGQGSGCTLTYTVTTGAISAVTAIAAGGSGYKAGDCITVVSGNFDAVIRVLTLSGSAVLTVEILYGGTGYSNGTAAATMVALSDPYKWRLSGTLTSNATFIFPNGTYLTQSDQYIIANNTTGSFTATFFVSNGSNATTGTGVAVPQGTNNSAQLLIETDGVSDVWAVGATASASANTPQTILPTMAANACTISALNSVPLTFRSATLGSGAVSTVATPSTNLVIPQGATLGLISGVQGAVLVAEMNNGGVREYAVSNQAGGLQCDERNLISTTAISASATAANVWYSTSARTNLPYKIVAVFESTQATAGQWATAASLVQSAFGEAFTGLSGLGYGQTWQNVSASRALSTTYYNTTGKPIGIAYIDNSASIASIVVSGLTVSKSQLSAGWGCAFSIIPPGAAYYVAGGGISVWAELR